MPPPTPTSPEINPMLAPVARLTQGGTDVARVLSDVSGVLLKARCSPDKSSAVPSSPTNTCSETGKRPPSHAKGMDVARNGVIRLMDNCLDRQNLNTPPVTTSTLQTSAI